jgi:hypothetical protein
MPTEKRLYQSLLFLCISQEQTGSGHINITVKESLDSGAGVATLTLIAVSLVNIRPTSGMKKRCNVVAPA